MQDNDRCVLLGAWKYDVTHSKAIPHPVKQLRSDLHAIALLGDIRQIIIRLLGQQRMPVAPLIELKEKAWAELEFQHRD